MTKIQPKIGILMGSDSDLEVMREAEKRLDSFAIAYETRILSAHRTPEKAAEYAATAQQRGLEVIICGAGAACAVAVDLDAVGALRGERDRDGDQLFVFYRDCSLGHGQAAEGPKGLHYFRREAVHFR